MRMQIRIGYANFIEPLALISDQSRLARPGLTKDLQIARPSFGGFSHSLFRRDFNLSALGDIALLP